MRGRKARGGPPWAAVLAWSLLVAGCAAAPAQPPEVFNITRVDGGDKFSFKGSECTRRECGGRSETMECACACPKHHPVYREDVHQCVDDVTECSVAPFGSGPSAQKIPFVFLPLKGQIIYPSKEISFPGVRTPICAVSGAQFLTRNGFVDLRSTVDSDVPFSLFRDEGRTFLQWTGEPEMRERMEGRLLVVQLLCRDVAAAGVGATLQGVFTPCAAFRVAGSPIRHITNVSEVLFAPDARSSDDSSSAGLSLTEYIAIGVSSVLLGLVYVASVFLYLHIRKRRTKSISDASEDNAKTSKANREIQRRDVINAEKERRVSSISNNENIIVKNNPLLGIARHFHDREKIEQEFPSDSEGCPSDREENVDEEINEEEMRNSLTHQVTAVTVHPEIHNEGRKIYESYYKCDYFQQREESSFERLPEENVSIVETFDFRDEKPESVPIGNTRKKLYFNPAYFEPHLLVSPPPAAIEFLIKIREVISIAKHKMASKRFTPSLGGIPEENTYRTFDNQNFYHVGSQRSSVISLKRDNIRRRPYCSGCPGCNSNITRNIPTIVPDISNSGVCHNCSSINGINKQVSIRKWLEGVPILKSSISYSSNSDSDPTPDPSIASGLLNSLLSLPKDNSDNPRKYYDFTSRSLYAEDTTNNFLFKKKKPSSSIRSEPSKRTFNIPLPSIPQINASTFYHDSDKTVSKIKDISSIGIKVPKKVENNGLRVKSPLHHQKIIMPDMINEALEMDKSKKTLEKRINSQNQYEAVEVVSVTTKNVLENNSGNASDKQSSSVDYEADSLERGSINHGLSTPTDYADISSSQASPSLSSALPMDEEMIMRNAIYKINSSSRPSSRLSNKEKRDQSPKLNSFYEPVEKIDDVVSTNAFENHIYSFPELPADGKTDYSLVSEVYVNNGYNFGSTPTTPSESDCSTFGKRKAIVRYDQPNEKPGRLTIELKDSPEDYIKIHESDGFEPDTLDRKPTKIKIKSACTTLEKKSMINGFTEKNIMDIKTTGLFKSSSLSHANNLGEAFHAKKSFGSIKEIYESKNYGGLRPSINNIKFTNPKDAVDSQDYEIIDNGNTIIDSDEGRILTLESRHCKRQRQSTPPSLKTPGKAKPPDVIPFEETVPIYEYPKPPRKVELEIISPPLPPKNESGRSPSSRNEFNIVMAIDRRGDTLSPFTLSSGLCSPSGASVLSDNSSDYENIQPVNDPETLYDGKSQTSFSYEIVNNISKENETGFDASKNDKLLNSSCKSTSKLNFRECQTPKAGKKLNQITPKKLINNRQESIKKAWRRGNQHKEDSGYLSTDSNDSRRLIRRRLRDAKASGSETDESIEDARSESGAESIETHSVFFGSFRKMSLIGKSMDSGMGSNDGLRNLISPFTESHSSQISDSEDTAVNILKGEIKSGIEDNVLY